MLAGQWGSANSQPTSASIASSGNSPSQWQPSRSLPVGLCPHLCGPRLSTAPRERRKRMATGNVVIVGGTQGLGRELAQSYADGGRDVVVTGRDLARAEAAANEIGG